MAQTTAHRYIVTDDQILSGEPIVIGAGRIVHSLRSYHLASHHARRGQSAP